MYTIMVIALKKELKDKDKKIEQLQQRLCPNCKEIFIKIFEDSKR